jgi:hypothetical protein
LFIEMNGSWLNHQRRPVTGRSLRHPDEHPDIYLLPTDALVNAASTPTPAGNLNLPPDLG